MPPAVISTVPLGGWDTLPMESGPASMSVSLARTHQDHGGAGSPSFTVAVSLTAFGGSSTQVTVTDTVALAPSKMYTKVSGGVTGGALQ